MESNTVSTILFETEKKFRDTSTDCAICLSPLRERSGGGSDGDGDGSVAQSTKQDEHAEVLELACGHLYHFECLREQLEHARPQHSQRLLLFGGARCAQCNQFCDHPALEHLTRRTDELRSTVDAMIREQLEVDYPEEYKALFQSDDRNDATEEAWTQLMDQGRRTYAFYLCSGCSRPYFGGTVTCADQTSGELTVPADRLCPSCSPPSQSIGCTNPLEHRGYHVWKCRYCCQPGTHVCYGTTHFCDGCHDRNSALVRQLQEHRRGTRQQPQEAPLTTLEPRPCPGRASCPFPCPEGCDSHSNGSTSACEQVYYCAWCESSSEQRSVVPGSRNWILNPSGGHGLAGWTQHSTRSHGGILPWRVEAAEIPPDQATATNFVSSYRWSVQSQSVRIGRILRHPARIEVSCKFTGRTDCPSMFHMGALVVGHHRHQAHPRDSPPIIERVATIVLQTSPDCWETARLEFSDLVDPDRCHSVVLVVAGKDGRFWAGDYGAKVASCSVRVLGDGEELERVLQPNALRWMEELEHGLTTALERGVAPSLNAESDGSCSIQ